MNVSLLISCEHAGNDVPPQWVPLFRSNAEALGTHEGWDPGAWDVAQQLGHDLKVPYFGCLTTRLLIEANRSLSSKQLYSRFSMSLSADEKQQLIETVYLPYRNEVKHQIDGLKKPVFHLSVHSFTPVLHDVRRTTDIGLLFDPQRKFESDICNRFRALLKASLPDYTIDFNKPYLGTDDGFTTFLRTCYEDASYAGVEIEINQRLIPQSAKITEAISLALRQLLEG